MRGGISPIGWQIVATSGSVSTALKRAVRDHESPARFSLLEMPTYSMVRE